jgi:hypothetical protein
MLMLGSLAFGQYKIEPAGPPPSELSAGMRDALQKDGIKVVGPNGSLVCELWFRTQAPSGPASTEQGVSLPTIPHGSLLGALRFPNGGQDRRGFSIKAGVYTLRYSLYPPDGNHQGVAPQRDFLLLTPAGDDSNVNATPSFDELVKMSAKSTGGTHPGVLSIWKDDPGTAQGITQDGEDWVLHTKIGVLPIAMIVVGTFQG